MNYQPTNNKDFEAFESEYQKEEKEILVLTSNDSGGACGFRASWDASMDFLAYVDIATNELRNGDGRVNWLISEEESKQHGCTWPYHFKKGAIYRLRVRELADKTVPSDRLPSYYNRFMVIDVLEKDVQHDELLAILAEYNRPVKIADQVLGEFELNKDLELFSGEIKWLGEEVSVSLEVSAGNKASWTKAMNALRTLFEQQKQRDLEFRTFAAEHLTSLANEWREDEETKEISKTDFIDRISLSELAVTSGGNYTAYYDDDDIFAGHAVTVYGSNKAGLKSASIEG